MSTLLASLTPIIPTRPFASFSSPLTPSSSSSLTAVSRSPSPSSLRPSRIFSYPVLHFSSEDNEKALPGSGPSSSRTGISKKQKRLLGQGLMLVTVLGIVGAWMGGVDLAGHLSQRGGPTHVPPSRPVPDSPIPGVVVGEGGVYLGTIVAAPPPEAIPTPEQLPAYQSEAWGVRLKTNHFLDGLTPWPPNPPIDDSVPPLSSLGYFADNIYKLGPLTLPEYTAQLLEFSEVAFPKHVTERLKNGLNILGNAAERGGDWDANKRIWQTDKSTRHTDSQEVTSWRGGMAQDDGWRWALLTDPQADDWVSKNLARSRIEMMWNNLPSGILRSDTLRYLLLLLEGGIYSDTDTSLLKPPSSWGQGARLWRDGAGWLDDASLERISAGEGIDAALGQPSVVVGVEADVGDRSDWFSWWPRPIQVVQWTMAMAPNHPIALSAVLRVLHSTAGAVEWSHKHASDIKHLKDLGRYDDSKALSGVTVLAEPNEGGPVGVMSWTGPGVWTDAVLSYLRVRYGMLWTDLKGIQEPLRVGDVVILPVTGFSPGVGNFGSQGVWHKEAMVQHKFRGSWKEGGESR